MKVFFLLDDHQGAVTARKGRDALCVERSDAAHLEKRNAERLRARLVYTQQRQPAARRHRCCPR